LVSFKANDAELLELRADLEKLNVQSFTLHDKSASTTKRFSIVNESDLLALSKNLEEVTKSVDLEKLEVEYDYDTEEEQCAQSKNFLYSDLWYAVDFFIKECPLKLVDNLEI
jgi:hypothetical protein